MKYFPSEGRRVQRPADAQISSREHPITAGALQSSKHQASSSIGRASTSTHRLPPSPPPPVSTPPSPAAPPAPAPPAPPAPPPTKLPALPALPALPFPACAPAEPPVPAAPPWPEVPARTPPSSFDSTSHPVAASAPSPALKTISRSFVTAPPSFPLLPRAPARRGVRTHSAATTDTTDTASAYGAAVVTACPRRARCRTRHRPRTYRRAGAAKPE